MAAKRENQEIAGVSLVSVESGEDGAGGGAGGGASGRQVAEIPFPALRKGGSTVLKERLTDARRQALEADRERKAAQQRASRLEAETRELRAILEDYAEQLGGSPATDGKELDALRAELELVRYQAATDVETLRGELESARVQAGLAVDAAAVEERQQLEQQVDGLERALQEREGELSRLKDQIDETERRITKVQEHRSRNADGGEAVEARTKVAERSVDRRLPPLAQARVRDAGPAWRAAGIGLVLGGLLVIGGLYGYLLLEGKGDRMLGLLQQSLEGPRQRLDRLLDSWVLFDSQPDSVSEERSPQLRRLPRELPAPIEKPTPAPIETQTRGRSYSRKSSLRDRLSGGGLGPRMLWIPAATFSMGSHQQALFPDEEPPHEVRLGGYFIAERELSFEQYDRFARETGRGLPDDQGWGRGAQPVVNVSWEDARAYTDWLSEQTGRVYRLASEAEWEYAAAGGSDGFYWWGYALDYGRGVCFNCGSRWDALRPAPVGTLGPNAYGLYNTAGNVMEWVADCYHGSYRGAPVDGAAWLEPGCGFRVARGGAFNRPAGKMRTTSRTRYDPRVRLDMLGFRVVRER